MISYKYKLYRTKNERYLERMLSEACFVWNHALALQRRFYSICGKYIPCARMQRHFARRIRRTSLHSQSVQEILQRLDAAYQRFFEHTSRRPPKFKRSSDFSSFCFKQGGFKLSGNTFRVNSIKKTFKFSLSRPYDGNVRQVRVKRSHLREYYICIVTDASPKSYAKTHNGASVGIDFGLKTYMTLSDGSEIENPQFLRRDLAELRSASRALSRKARGSRNRERARLALCRLHERIENRRSDYQWKLAHSLCRRYDTIFIEDLSLKSMSKHWGRKMSDLGHGRFCEILSLVSSKYGCRVHKIDRWFPSSRLCECGYKNSKLKLSDRSWVCPSCSKRHDRDAHAAEMILRRGIYESASDRKTRNPLGFVGSRV